MGMHASRDAGEEETQQLDMRDRQQSPLIMAEYCDPELLSTHLLDDHDHEDANEGDADLIGDDAPQCGLIDILWPVACLARQVCVPAAGVGQLTAPVHHEHDKAHTACAWMEERPVAFGRVTDSYARAHVWLFIPSK